MSAIDGLAGFLQLTNSFVEQAHLAEGDAKVVMGFGIFFVVGGTDFEIVTVNPLELKPVEELEDDEEEEDEESEDGDL